MEQSVDAMSLSMFNSSFLFSFFLYYAYPIMNLFIFLCCAFYYVNSKMLNEFSILTRLIKYILG